jgi:hypothetical protein
MTRQQEDLCGLLAQAHGRVHVNEGFTDGHVELTVPNGTSFHVSKHGRVVSRSFNHSIYWSYE